MPRSGDVFAAYTIDSPIGRGGSAEVFLAHRDSRTVALKILDPRHRTPETIDRLRREYQLAHRLSHPRIITVYDHGEDWIAMEAIDGGSAADLVGTDQTWLIEIKLTVLQQIAGALDYIHENGVIHCDVKPANILRRRGGDAVLTDFGVAQTTSEAHGPRPPVVLTSLPYAAPEVLLGQPVCAATDQYALACTAVELFDGKPPFTANTTAKLMDLQLRATPWPISYRHDDIPRAFDSIVLRAMEKDPANRYATCTEFVTLLTHVLT